MTEHIRVTVEDRVMRIAFNRPEKKNAITNAMYLAVGEALNRAESDPQIRAVLFEAEGDAFTAGNDLADFAAVAAGKMARSSILRSAARVISSIRRSRGSTRPAASPSSAPTRAGKRRSSTRASASAGARAA